MSLRYDRKTDRYVGDGAGLGSGWPRFELDEIEMGGRVAITLAFPYQAWWEIIGRARLAEEEPTWTDDGRNLPGSMSWIRRWRPAT